MTNKNTPFEKLSFDRRTFLGSAAAGLSLLSASHALGVAQSGAQPRLSPTAGQSIKSWANEYLRGGESFIMPSYKADLKTLDEEGVRRDVRHAVAQGLCSILPLTVLDQKNGRLLQEIVADEAKNKIFIVGILRPGEWKDMADDVRYMESVGTTHALMYFNPRLSSQEAIYKQMRSVIDNTSLGIILYAKPSDAIKHLDPTGLPMDAFDKLADLDKVVGVKFTQELRPATAFGVAERLGDRLSLGVVDLELMLPLSLKYKIQWTGQWAIDSLQSPQQPWVGQYLELLRQGKNHEAYQLYWHYEPIASYFYALQAPSLSIGGHPWMHIKYMKWLTGGNGGLLCDLKEKPDYVPHLNAEDRVKCREAFASVGIKTVDLPDDAFVVGNAEYERGVRAKDMVALPQYSV